MAERVIGRRTIVELLCSDEYIHQKVKSGDHSEIRIRIIFRKTPYYLKKRGKTLAEAKEIAQKFISANPKIAYDD